MRNQLLVANERNRDTITYSILIQIIKHLCSGGRLMVHVQGRIDLSSLRLEDLEKLEAALIGHDKKILVISKQKSLAIPKGYSIIKYKTLKETERNRLMERLEKVHISYKHDANYDTAIEAIMRGLIANDIEFSIDEYDIMYRDDIEEYEKEIGNSDRIIMFVVPSYLKSIDCMFEMTQMFANGNIRERIFPVVDMGKIPRNGDTLKQIKDYWQREKERKAEQIKTEPGSSTFVIKELEKIDNILKWMDDFWDYIVHINTGKYEDLIANDAALLIEELKTSHSKITPHIDEKFIPSHDTKPHISRAVNQTGEKSIYIENNTGSITIN